jgi:murein DD-endopeptidase MepM/ murein hydrolase activator NlpD
VSAILVFAIVFSLLHGELVYRILARKSLVQENEKLKRYNTRVVELEKELKEYKSFVNKVANLAGVKYEAGSTKQLAYLPEEAKAEDKGSPSLSPGQDDRKATSGDEASIGVLPKSLAANPDSLKHIPIGAPIEGWVTKEFSVNNPKAGGNHPGVDFATKIGTKVKATADGKVIASGWDDLYGNEVAIDHGNGYVTYFGHNLKILVSTGALVHRGDVIALSGSSGRSSAPHLHYEIKKNGVAIDPKVFLNQSEVSRPGH